MAEVTASSESLASKLGFAVLTAVLAGGTAWLSTVFTRSSDREKWERETTYAYGQTVFNKRVELIDATVKVLSKPEWINNLDIVSQNTVTSMEHCAEALKQHADPKCEQKVQALNAQNLEIHRQWAEAQGAWNSALSLDSTFFGPHTKTTVEKIRDAGQPLEKVDGALISDLVRNMGEELYYGFHFSANLTYAPPAVAQPLPATPSNPAR